MGRARSIAVWPVLMMFRAARQGHQHSDTRQVEESSAFPTTSCGKSSSMRRCRRRSFSVLTFRPRHETERSRQLLQYSAIDWDEFNQVLAAHAVQRDRCGARKAHGRGAWVRECPPKPMPKRAGIAKLSCVAASSRIKGSHHGHAEIPLWKFSFEPNGLATSTSVRAPSDATLRCRPRAISKPAAARGCRSGWCRRVDTASDPSEKG